MLPFYPCPYQGQSIFVTVSHFTMLNPQVAGLIMVRHINTFIVLALRVYYLMRCTHNALRNAFCGLVLNLGVCSRF
jgi:hypothetical protein